MTPRPRISPVLLRYACLLTAVVNLVGSVTLAGLHRSVLAWVGAAPPADPRAFVVELSLSFTMGVVALLVFTGHRDPARTKALLAVGALGKGLYAVVTYGYFVTEGTHWLWLGFAAWDALFVVVFLLYWIQLESPDLARLHAGLFNGVERARTGKALLLGFSLTGNGSRALERVAAGLRRGGYRTVDVVPVEPLDSIHRFPLGFVAFWRIIVRSFLRIPTPIAELGIPDDHDYDLVVVESPTWLLGAAAPVEAIFQDERNARILRGRDAAAVVVCRGAHRRTAAMLVRGLERRGANVVAVRSLAHQGREPRRLLSLWLYLVFRHQGVPAGIAEPHYGPPPRAYDELEAFGEDLAHRPRTRPHWALLEEDPTDA